MATVSGQENSYKFDLDNRSPSSPVTHIRIHTDTAQRNGSYITLGIEKHLKPEFLAEVKQYVTTHLSALGARLVTWNPPSFSGGKMVAKEEAPSYIKVADSFNARIVINHLFQCGEMSAKDRSTIEDALRELEKSAQFANERAESISIAQKDAIQSVISPYIKTIMSAAKGDSEIAKKWVQSASNALKTFGADRVAKLLPNILWTNCGLEDNQEPEFYQSLSSVAKFYCSMGNLESALKQLGESLPSETLVQQAIFALFDESMVPLDDSKKN